jgi:hypothetical protein
MASAIGYTFRTQAANNARLFMAIVLKVKWVDQSDQPDPYQRIRQIGGASRKFQWKHTRAQAIESIERGTFVYYVERDARAVNLEVGLAPNGCKYLKTQADDDQHQLLLSLSECPKPVPLLSPDTSKQALSHHETPDAKAAELMKVQLSTLDSLLRTLREKQAPDPKLLAEVEKAKATLQSSWNDHRRRVNTGI